MTSRLSSLTPGLLLLSRVAAAVFGGYALAAAVAFFLAAVLPTGRAEAVVGGMQFSFAVHAIAAIWAFSPVALMRVWLWLLLPAVVLAGLGWSLRGVGA
ncbi:MULTISPECIES: hypothetical protein [Variovorax]|jgi:hypothetical protein|uniref:hypothetical protein n=1 Tax=Variovorax TaxID=34072 RepID=UPI00086861E9|nr:MULTISPECIES: hypothetical protein [Variovorax]MBN8755910.1 hypothetical protein [Variovorax sp.]ODU15122.1 MAG: hypothetical protein ABS94_19830 [Variovorax sp. SCN 67-85]OJZ09955.1 MAG: hypothetical protein BGP22_27120 [Variovorax sp. 67-131]UKI06562.1 hypothetical protein L3V85_27650 [Variovorax paradoxus]